MTGPFPEFSHSPAELAFDPEMLARELAEELLGGRIKDGDLVKVGVKGGLLTFNGLPVGGKAIDPKVVQLH